MIKKQFTKSGGVDLNGMTISSQNAGTSVRSGMCFPKIKTNSPLTFTFRYYGYTSSDIEVGGPTSARCFIGDGNTTTSLFNGTIGWRKNSWGSRRFTVPAGTTFSCIYAGDGGKHLRRCYFTVTFNDVEMIDD